MNTRIDKNSNITYEVTEHIPHITRVKSKSTVQMLTFYGMYRNGLYDTRIDNPLDADIAAFKPRYNYNHQEAPERTNNHLYHYASYVSIDAMQELFKMKGSKCCIAYRTDGNRKIPLGFLVFYEKIIDQQKIVYISHLSSRIPRQGIGTRIIQTVMANYPADTTFYLCARGRNKGALAAYEKLGFEYDHKHLNEFGYNPEYFIGMSHITSDKELKDIDSMLVSPEQSQYESIFESERQKYQLNH